MIAAVPQFRNQTVQLQFDSLMMSCIAVEIYPTCRCASRRWEIGLTLRLIARRFPVEYDRRSPRWCPIFLALLKARG